MAYIRVLKRADGSLAHKVFWRDPDTKKQTSFTTDSETEADLIKRLLDANGQSFTLANQAMSEIKSAAPTVNKIFTEYLGELTKIESGTKKKYVSMWKTHIEDSIGGTKLDMITRARVVEWFDNLDRAPKTKKNIHALLSATLSRGVSLGLLESNPAIGVSVPKASLRPREAVFLTKDEVEMIADHLGEYGLFIHFLAGTGLRYGEATALRRKDFQKLDAEHYAVNVARAWKSTAHGYKVGSPKTRSSYRTVTLGVTLSAKVGPVLEKLRYDDLLFAKPAGTFLRPGWFFEKHWDPALISLLGGECGHHLFKRPRLQDLRHTHVSLLIAAGVPLPVIKERLGHASIMVTADTYGHLSNDADMKAADALG